jgi:2,4-dienoyl-CoA reductase-like NADH-dependent reductase (Old Yellow Enzyme family)
MLFEPMNIKGMDLRNRFVRSATGDRSADTWGNVSEMQIRLYEALSAGGVGLNSWKRLSEVAMLILSRSAGR